VIPDDTDALVCICHHVTEGQLISACGDGAATADDVQTRTYAGTGCGDCAYDIEEIVAEWRAQRSA
jgi:NAD(P)H-nitrite reductase large subunit